MHIAEGGEELKGKVQRPEYLFNPVKLHGKWLPDTGSGRVQSESSRIENSKQDAQNILHEFGRECVYSIARITLSCSVDESPVNIFLTPLGFPDNQLIEVCY